MLPQVPADFTLRRFGSGRATTPWGAPPSPYPLRLRTLRYLSGGVRSSARSTRSASIRLRPAQFTS